MSASLLAALLLQVAYQTSGTPVMASERVQTYDIAGTTAAELWDQIGQFGPTDPGTGQHYAGDLRSEIHWNVQSHFDAASCRVESIEVVIDSVETVPRWTNPQKASNALQVEWDGFLERLKEHESGHRSNAVKAAQAVREAIDGVGVAPDCATLKTLVDKAAAAVIKRWKEVDIDYDRTTRHGATQGAVLQ